jgi:hypothetical protein
MKIEQKGNVFAGFFWSKAACDCGDIAAAQERQRFRDDPNTLGYKRAQGCDTARVFTVALKASGALFRIEDTQNRDL